MKSVLKHPLAPKNDFRFKTTNVTFSCVKQIFLFDKRDVSCIGIDRKLLKEHIRINQHAIETQKRNEAIRKNLIRRAKKARKISFNAYVEIRLFGESGSPLADFENFSHGIATCNEKEYPKGKRPRDLMWSGGDLPPMKRRKVD